MTEAQGFALEAVHQFCPELEFRDDDSVLLTCEQLEVVMRHLGWAPPGEPRSILIDAVLRARPYVQAEMRDLLCSVGGLSDKAFERVQKEAHWIKVMADAEAVDAAVNFIHGGAS